MNEQKIHRLVLNNLTNLLEREYDIGIEIGASSPDKVKVGLAHQNTISINSCSRGILEQAFVISHLFGHMVQYLDFEKYKTLVEQTSFKPPLSLSAGFKASFREYEAEAFSYGFFALSSIASGIDSNLYHKYLAYFNLDFDRYWIYLTTGEVTTNDQFNRLLEEYYQQDFIDEIQALYPKNLKRLSRLCGSSNLIAID